MFGDGSGNDDDEWVAVWGRDYVSTTAAVNYRVWEPTNRRYSAAQKLGAAGPTVQIWNSSIISPDMSLEPARIAQAWQPSDLVVLSYGHRRTANEITGQLDALVTAIRAKDAAVPILVMIQNPDRVSTEAQQRATTEKVQQWAAAKSFATIDIYTAFMTDARPRNDMVEADGSPTPAGSKLWASAFASQLG